MNLSQAKYSGLNLNLLCAFADRGNDNWLLKYDCPMDPVGNRVRIHRHAQCQRRAFLNAHALAE